MAEQQHQSWQAKLQKTNSDSVTMTDNDTSNMMSATETVQNDFQKFVQRLFSVEPRCDRLDDDMHVHKGVNLAEVLSRLESIIPSPNQKTISPDTYNHISILSQNIQSYLQLLNTEGIEKIADRISTDTIKWISQLFGLDSTSSIFHTGEFSGLLKVCRLALHSKYSKYASDGFTALYTRPPVVYISAAAPVEFGQHLRNELGLPQSSICSVPCNTMFGSPFAMDVSAFERLLTDDVSCGKTPLMLIAYAGTPLSGHTDNLGRLREICTQSGVWMHVEGDSLANLTLSHVQPSIQVAVNSDSLTLNLSKWFGMLTLPHCTFFKVNNPNLVVSNVLHNDYNDKLVALPLWILIQFMGTHDLKKIIEHACGLSQQMSNRLDIINGIKRTEQPTGISPVILFKYKAQPTLPLSLEVDSEKPKKAAPRGKIDVPPAVVDAFNNLVIDELSKTCPKVVLESVHLPKEGSFLKFNPLQTSRSHSTSKVDVDDYVEKLQALIVKMDYTLINRSSFQESFQRIADVNIIECADQPAIGAFQCIPKYWKTKTMSNLSDMKKQEANDLNQNILCALSHLYPCVSKRVLQNGQICIQVGIVDDKFDLQKFAETVLTCTIEMEDNTKFVESVSDSVQQSIVEAQQKLERERDEKFFQDGVLRSVPVVGSFYNWWSPPAKENHGVTGKTFDLSSGKLESTEKTYKYKIQVHDDEDASERLSQISKASHASSKPNAAKETSATTQESTPQVDVQLESKEDSDGSLSEIDSSEEKLDVSSDDIEQDITLGDKEEEGVKPVTEEGEEVKESDV